MAESSAPNLGQPVRADEVFREMYVHAAEREACPRPRPSAPNAVGARTHKSGQPVRAEAVLREPDVHAARRAASARPRRSVLEAVGAHASRRTSPKTSGHLQTEIRGRRHVGGQGSRRFGDVLSAVNSSINRSVSYEDECEMSYVDNVDHMISSSDKENVNSGRKRCLDDALFQFFRNDFFFMDNRSLCIVYLVLD